MCGIAGIVGLGEPLAGTDREELRKMTSVLFHRGPDGIRHVDFPRCSLGNTRLDIIDLSEGGALPMANADRSVWIAYNGEVTNFRELEERFELRANYPFRSTTDTEVLLHLYEELGIDFCRHLTGQFAFAIHDARAKKVFIVRDFYGIRPLFFMRARGRLYFASEIKAFLELARFEKHVDLEALHHYFTLGYMPVPRTPFRQVEELPGAHQLEIDLSSGEVRSARYYRINYAPEPVRDEHLLAERLHQEMRDSVRRNLIADVPVGLTLSGGFDTSSILALAREVVPERDIHTYSIVIDEPSFDESPHQHVMSTFARSVHHELHVGPHQIMDALERQMAFMDEPTANGAAVPSFLLAEVAKRDVKVLLSGEGGDETFTAYETHRAWKMRRLYRRLLPSSARTALRRAVHAIPSDYRKLSFDFMAKRFTDGAELDAARAHIYWRHTLTDADKAALMPTYRAEQSTGDLVAGMCGSYPFPHGLDRLSALDLETYFIGDLMVKNDRTIMAHSIETRFPYMDRLLFDFVARIPADLRMKGFAGRYMQKLAMKGRLPPSIHGRKNMGLELPHSLWLLREMRPLVGRYLSPERIGRTGFLSHAAVQRLWDEHQSGRRDNGRALWSIITLMVWFELFVETNGYKRHLRTARESVPAWMPGT